jgi:hypothetical protein
MSLEAVIIAIVILWAIKQIIFDPRRKPVDIRKEWNETPTPTPKAAKPSPTRSTYELKAESRPLVEMPEATSRLLTYEDERRAAWARQRLWIRYQDKGGNVTERTVEIYQPEKDEVLFTWCCLKREPRTFARRNILSWRLLPERFEYDSTVARYWDEEAGMDLSEKMPWRRWLDTQPPHIAKRYQ